MPDTNYDAIVVGSGISGGWAAKELTEKGLNVLILERGKNIEHVKDYVNATKAPWEYPHRGGRTRAMEELYPVLKRDYALNEKNLDYWASDKDSPYTEIKRFDWYRGYHVGGRSLMWGRQSYRWSDFDFEANAKDGIAIDWPIRYADIAPWYDHVEKHAGIAGSHEGLAQLPDGQFQPAMPLNCGEELIAGRLTKLFGGQRRLIPGRTANLTKELTGRSACQYRNACWLGCPYGAYFSTQSSTLPAAAKTGRMTLRPFAIASEVIYDKDTKRATGVRVLDAITNQTTDYKARVIFLCASTINSAWLLMRSATDVWPGGLGSSSGELGHNLMDHHFRAGAQGKLGDGRQVLQRPPAGRLLHPALPKSFRRQAPLPARLRLPGKRRSGGMVEGCRRDGRRGAVQGLDDGARPMVGWRHGVRRDASQSRQHGLDRSDQERQVGYARREDRLRDWRERADDAQGYDRRHGGMLDQTGVKKVEIYDAGYFPGMGIHEMGTARMGRDPKTSVLNSHNQVWDAPNVFVTDGSCMASSACVNPSLTYMALTARAADFAVGELNRHNI